MFKKNYQRLDSIPLVWEIAKLAPKVLGDIVESIAGATFLDNDLDTSVVWKVFQPLLQPIVTPEHFLCIQLENSKSAASSRHKDWKYKASRMGNLATVEVFIYIDGVQIGAAQNPQKKMAQKLAARNVLAILKEKNEKDKENIELRNTDRGWTDECIGEQMPSVKKAKDSAAVLLLELPKKVYPEN